MSRNVNVVILCEDRQHEAFVRRFLDRAGKGRRIMRVAVFVPARNIETRLAYLDGQEVDERTSYPRLLRERECQRHAERLYEMCRQQALRAPAPPSLETACEEYRERLES